jgi:superfamily II DNA or RNA helicase
MSRSEIVKERPIQTKAFDSVTKLLETRGECLVKMFCGTGKSHVMKRLIMEQKKSLSIIVFPSLALIRQFTNDYLRDIETRVYGIMNVSSEELTHITSTTDPAQIHHFLNNPKTKQQKKIICVTYQSLDVLLSSIGDTKSGLRALMKHIGPPALKRKNWSMVMNIVRNMKSGCSLRRHR